MSDSSSKAFSSLWFIYFIFEYVITVKSVNIHILCHTTMWQAYQTKIVDRIPNCHTTKLARKTVSDYFAPQRNYSLLL